MVEGKLSQGGGLYMAGKTKGIISMVCGIVSVVGCYSYGAGIVIAIVGLILNKQAKSSGYSGTPAKVGKITSVIGLILSIVGLVLGVSLTAAAKKYLK